MYNRHVYHYKRLTVLCASPLPEFGHLASAHTLKIRNIEQLFT